MFEDGRYLTERITEEATGFIRRNRDRPFFTYVAYNALHYPCTLRRSTSSRFAGLDRERRMYAAMLAAVDDGIGEIREALEETGQLENTLIFFVGDNGATTEKRAGLGQQYAAGGPQREFSRLQVQPVRRRHARARHSELARNESAPGRTSARSSCPWTFCRRPVPRPAPRSQQAIL